MTYSHDNMREFKVAQFFLYPSLEKVVRIRGKGLSKVVYLSDIKICSIKLVQLSRFN